MLLFCLMLTAGVSADASWAGDYAMTSTFHASTCQAPCPPGAAHMNISLQAATDGFSRLWIQPVADLYLAYTCKEDGAALTCRAEFPLEGPGVEMLVDGLIRVNRGDDGGLDGDIIETYTEILSGVQCACSYTLRAPSVAGPVTEPAP